MDVLLPYVRYGYDLGDGDVELLVCVLDCIWQDIVYSERGPQKLVAFGAVEQLLTLLVTAPSSVIALVLGLLCDLADEKWAVERMLEWRASITLKSASSFVHVDNESSSVSQSREMEPGMMANIARSVAHSAASSRPPDSPGAPESPGVREYSRSAPVRLSAGPMFSIKHSNSNEEAVMEANIVQVLLRIWTCNEIEFGFGANTGLITDPQHPLPETVC